MNNIDLLFREDARSAGGAPLDGPLRWDRMATWANVVHHRSSRQLILKSKVKIWMVKSRTRIDEALMAAVQSILGLFDLVLDALSSNRRKPSILRGQKESFLGVLKNAYVSVFKAYACVSWGLWLSSTHPQAAQPGLQYNKGEQQPGLITAV